MKIIVDKDELIELCNKVRDHVIDILNDDIDILVDRHRKDVISKCSPTLASHVAIDNFIVEFIDKLDADICKSDIYYISAKSKNAFDTLKEIKETTRNAHWSLYYSSDKEQWVFAMPNHFVEGKGLAFYENTLDEAITKGICYILDNRKSRKESYTL